MPNNLNSTTLSALEGIAFPHLTPRDLEQLRPFGTPCSYEDGQVIFSAGDDAADLFIVESGAMEILNPAQDNRSVVTHGPGQFSGDIDLLTRRPPLVTGVARGRTAADAHRRYANSRSIEQSSPFRRDSARRRPGATAPSCWKREQSD
jgi:CRP-like cAMP-binding protein